MEQVHRARDATTHEDRRFQRVDDTLLVSYSISDDFAPEFTETYDIALGGMAMLTNAELARDAPIAVQLELRGDSQPILRLSGVIRWSRYDPLLQRHRTGVAFLDVNDEMRAHLQRYIDTLHLLRDMGML
ncbi:MAG: PilZ domain-containing protein [Candidatus Eremiobacteraeota bacterium]|nr:PilZ domain-containing protein [Candidatus Eremiobacteraeota bacterium]MBV8331172.1 PilZ domain-containing protein [Candidatus Eremiobacteraeota bacterium]MBV8433656.1 PilZ domain-containing protein [Candidatus Eremiobacteraeota bacterium]MBV8721082.1 PilZ domain-containing protein [Candidatus Eremiobacteraeota bacterium]